MTLSKKNIDKLNSISNNNLSIKDKLFDSKSDELSSSNPNDIFYSIIDNSNDINETNLFNKKLKESEEKFFNENYNNQKKLSKKLTEEELLYDEFNYLLDE
ncbi:MAG: hypothetical protein CMK49_03090 [Prochlorococcus sp. SP3034]|nr:hypothetical protein [Prochlorococcus sp. SP3034]